MSHLPARLGGAAAVAGILYIIYTQLPTKPPSQPSSIGSRQANSPARQQMAASAAAAKAACERGASTAIATSQRALKRKDGSAALDALYSCRTDLAGDPEFDKAYAAALSAFAAKNEQLRKARDIADAAERRRRGVSIGMTAEDVLGSQWGKPQRVNRTVNAFGTREQWVYGGGYLYFEDGILVTIHQRSP